MGRKLEHIKDGSWILWSESIKDGLRVFPFGLHSILRCQCTISWLIKHVCLTDCVCVKHRLLLYVFCVWTSSPVNMFVCILLSDQSFSQPSPASAPPIPHPPPRQTEHKTCIVVAFYSAHMLWWWAADRSTSSMNLSPPPALLQRWGKQTDLPLDFISVTEEGVHHCQLDPPCWPFSTGLVSHSVVVAWHGVIICISVLTSHVVPKLPFFFLISQCSLLRKVDLILVLLSSDSSLTVF